MDGTGIIVTLIFVYTMFTSLNTGKSGIGMPPRNNIPLDQRVPISTQLNVRAVPDPYYISISGEDALNNIEQFILKTNKKLSYWDVNQMSTSLLKYGGMYNVNPKLICALIARESTFNSRATSSSGAMGLGQLLPATAKSLRVDDAYDPEQNIRGTTRYMSFLLDKWKAYPQQVPLALASYAEGHNAITRNGYYKQQTRLYVEDIIKIYWKI